MQTGIVGRNGEIVSKDAFIDSVGEVPVTIDFNSDTKWGDATISHVGNQVYAEIKHIPLQLKDLYVVPSYVSEKPAEVVDGVKIETSVRIISLSLTDYPADPTLTTIGQQGGL